MIKPMLVLAGLLAATAGTAHHGNFTYDGSRVIILEGDVTAFHWSNPHGAIVIRTENGDEVEIEIDGPSLIRPMGVNRNSLMPGDRVIAYVSPSNRGRDNEVLGREIIKEDGSIVRVSVAFARQRDSADQPVAQSLLGTWVPDRTNLFTHVASSESWALTPAGQASFDAYDVSESFAQTQCRAATAPTLMMYPTANVLREVEGHIEINADWMGATRTIYMDGRERPGPDELFYQGFSTGRWEGDSLVIETTNFTPNPIGNLFSIASGPDKKLVERLTLAGDGRRATYTFTLTDPQYLAAVVTASYQWHYRPDVSASSEACDLEAASKYLR